MVRRLIIAALCVVVLLAVVVGVAVRRLTDPEVVRVAVERQASAAMGQPVSVGHVAWALSARPRVVLSDVRIGSPAAISIKQVEVATGLRALLSKRVENGGLVVSGSRIQLPLPFALGGGSPAAGAATSDAAGASTVDGVAAGFVIASIDRIAFDDIALVVGEHQLRVDVESSLRGERLTVSQVRLRSQKSSIEGQGELTSLSGRSGTFSFTADPLDLDELLTIASGVSTAPGTPAGRTAAGGDTAPGASLPLDVRIDVKAPRGRVLGIEFASLHTALVLKRNAITLDPFDVGLFDGALEGRVILDTLREPATLSLAASISGMDVAKVAALTGAGGTITGQLNGSLDLRAAAGPPETVFRSATGAGARDNRGRHHPQTGSRGAGGRGPGRARWCDGERRQQRVLERARHVPARQWDPAVGRSRDGLP